MRTAHWRAKAAGVIHCRLFFAPLAGARFGCSPLSAAQETSSLTLEASPAPISRRVAESATLSILLAISVSHMLNDMMQSLAPALYPVFRQQLGLTFFETGLITLTFQGTASLLQPFIGFYTDRRPQPYSLPVAMLFTLCGLALLAFGRGYALLLASVALIGIGSAIFHPEASRVARAASGGRHGFAQSLFQVGGNFGQSLGPLMAAFIVVPFGQTSVVWFSALALMGIAILTRVSQWYAAHRAKPVAAGAAPAALPRKIVALSLGVLVVLMISKLFYLSSLSSYYTFYLIQTFHISVQDSQVYLFVYLAAIAAETFAGGPIGDRFGRKFVIWGSIVGVLPFTLALPHLNLFWTVIDSVAIGLILASAFSAIVVYAQELVPGNVGLIAGLFFGLSFGLGGIGAALLGALADWTSLTFVYQVCAYLPAIGLLTYFLPNIRSRRL
jgi:FSR family fosmidomycin resistance protein-like MFS transporter